MATSLALQADVSVYMPFQMCMQPGLKKEKNKCMGSELESQLPAMSAYQKGRAGGDGLLAEGVHVHLALSTSDQLPYYTNELLDLGNKRKSADMP